MKATIVTKLSIIEIGIASGHGVWMVTADSEANNTALFILISFNNSVLT